MLRTGTSIYKPRSFQHFLLLLGILIFSSSEAQFQQWNYRSQITVTENSGSDLSNYQVLVRVNTATLIAQGKMNPDGSDVRFSTGCDGNNFVAFWIERYLNTDSTEIWLRVPLIPDSGTTTLWMFYGNPNATDQSNFGSVFPNAYKLLGSSNDILGGIQNYDWFEVQSGATVFNLLGDSLKINARKIIINGTIDGVGAGYSGATSGSNGNGPGGGGGTLEAGAGGGGYGGIGGDGGSDGGDSIGTGGITYGNSVSMAVDMGSGGGGGLSDSISKLGTGGNGGGALSLTGKVIEMNSADIFMDGANAEQGETGGGGGSGGTILIAGYNIDINYSTLTANGGDGGDGCCGDDDGGGSGGGGILKMFYENQFSSLIFPSVVAGNEGQGGGGTEDGNQGNDGSSFVDTFISTEPTTSVGLEVLMAKADFTSTAPQCTGATVDFTNTGTSSGVTFFWDFGSGATPGSSTQQNPTATYSAAGTKSITFVVTDGTCPDTIVQNINISETPASSFSSTAPQCAGIGVDFTNIGSSDTLLSYSWDFGQDAFPSTSFSENPMGVIYNSGGTKTVTLTISNQNCSNTTTQSIIINTSPIADFATTAPQCTGATVDFTNTGTSSGVSFFWDFGSGATPGSSTQQNPTATYSAAGTKSITFVVTDGTCPDTIVQNINISETPAVSFSSTSPQCAGVDVDFTNTGSSDTLLSYSWDLGQDAFPVTSFSENPMGVVYSSGGTKMVTLTISNQSCVNTIMQNISVNELPLADAGPDTTICANTSVQIGSSTVAGNIYTWNAPDNTLTNSSLSNPSASPIAAITEYIVTVVDSNSCVNMDTVTVTMMISALVDAGADAEICFGESVQLGMGLLQGQTYSWFPAASLNSAITPHPIADPDTTTLYTVTVSYEGCAIITDDVLVVVHPLPDANAGLDDSITIGSSTQLIATGGVQYTWFPTTGLDNPGIYNPIAGPSEMTIYSVEVIDIFGCVNTDTLTLTVISPSFWVPNAFTPGETTNNILFVRGEGIDDFEFWIFNRWGETVFSSNDLGSGWNGSHQISGKIMPEGAYVYVIKGTMTNGDPVNTNGLINLIR